MQEHAVAYLNSDGNEGGYFSAGGTQDLQSFISAVARAVPDPETALTAYQRAHLRAIFKAKDADERSETRTRSDLAVDALGDGSDYTAFQDFAGIPSLDLSFGGEDHGTQYHSIYDDFAWYTRFVDPDFAYGRALAQLAGSSLMRLADADLLPFDYAPQVDAIDKYESELEKLLKSKQDEYGERALERKEGVYVAIRDPALPMSPPTDEPVPPYMNFAPLKNALVALRKAADRYSDALDSVKKRTAPLSPAALATVNQDLLHVSRAFLDARGLPERPWFKNQIYAPGAYSGYGAKPIAAVREYMDQRKWQEADAQVPRVAAVLQKVAAAIATAAQDLTAATAD